MGSAIENMIGKLELTRVRREEKNLVYRDLDRYTISKAEQRSLLKDGGAYEIIDVVMAKFQHNGRPGIE